MWKKSLSAFPKEKRERKLKLSKMRKKAKIIQKNTPREDTTVRVGVCQGGLSPIRYQNRK